MAAEPRSPSDDRATADAVDRLARTLDVAATRLCGAILIATGHIRETKDVPRAIAGLRAFAKLFHDARKPKPAPVAAAATTPPKAATPTPAPAPAARGRR